MVMVRPTGACGGKGVPGSGLREDAYEASHASPVLEQNHTSHHREERVVLSPADIQARINSGAALAHQDRSTADQLPAEPFDTQSLRVAVPPVPGTSAGLLVS